MSPTSPPRFHIDAELAQGAEIDLPEPAVQHIMARRLREGEALVLFNGRGGEHEATVSLLLRGRCTARVGAHRDTERESTLSIALALGVSAGDRMDYAVQKATELGVERIVALATERSVVRLSPERAERRLAHWRGIAASACEQCGRNRLPAIDSVSSFDEFVAHPPEGLKLAFFPDGGARLGEVERSRNIVVLIGPEGGLSARERDASLASGFVGLRFGPRTLRTETAPVAVLAALQALWGDC